MQQLTRSVHTVTHARLITFRAAIIAIAIAWVAGMALGHRFGWYEGRLDTMPQGIAAGRHLEKADAMLVASKLDVRRCDDPASKACWMPYAGGPAPFAQVQAPQPLKTYVEHEVTGFNAENPETGEVKTYYFRYPTWLEIETYSDGISFRWLDGLAGQKQFIPNGWNIDIRHAR